MGSGASGKKRMQPSEANVAARMEDTWWKSIKSRHATIFVLGVHRFCIPVNKGKYCGQKGQGRQLGRIKYLMAKVKVTEVLSLGRQTTAANSK